VSDRLVLASASARRRELLERVGIALEVRPSSADETPRPGEEAAAYASRVAVAKVEEVARDLGDRWILGADTTVEVDRVILGKAADADEAATLLARLAGRVHRVTTAYALHGGGRRVTRQVTTEVVMRAVAPEEIAAYVASGEWRGKAGAYAVQGIAAAFVTAIRGSITNVIGLPLAEVIEDLARVGGPAPDYRAGVPA
jgi:septum formation protein